MADYQLTQTGDEVQDILDSALKVTGSGVTLTQSGADVQTLLNNIPSGKFRLLTTTNASELDAIPQVNGDWVVGIYDSSWASRPSSYGICFRVTASTQQWSWEIALSTDTPSPNLFVRVSVNGNAWTSWATK